MHKEQNMKLALKVHEINGLTVIIVLTWWPQNSTTLGLG